MAHSVAVAMQAETESLGRAMRARFVGLDVEAPLFDGRRRPYVNFDNAATTPALRAVADGVSAFLEWYGSVHRGTGAKSRVSTRAYDHCREMAAAFVGADSARHAVIFTRSTTDSINVLAASLAARRRRGPLARLLGRGRPRVLCSVMEHHSNLLPWRAHAEVEYIDLLPDGALDLDALERRLRRGGVDLVAVTAASNVTGLTPPLGRIARLAHAHGAEIFVDAAQLVAHRALRMGAADDPERIDSLAFSAHKMYAPFGAGVLIAPKSAFPDSPARVGGGAVRLVTQDEVVWADLPAREEAGTPNVIGAVALGKAIGMLRAIGMERVAAHDTALRERIIRALESIPGVRLYGTPAPEGYGHVGVAAFTAETLNHSLMAAALGHEWGIGVRHGCFCAHPYLIRLLGLDPSAAQELIGDARRDDHSRFPGLVRVSVGVYNTPDEVDYLAEAVRTLVAQGPRARYTLHRPTGEYIPEDQFSALDGAFAL